MVKSRSKTSRQSVKKSVPRAKPARKPAKGTKPAKGKWVYAFGGGKAAGRASMRNLLGGKGAGLAEMAHLGLPVPPGFTITTEVCTHFYDNGKAYPKDLKAQVDAALAEVGRITGKKFGDGENPLLVSVRSGGRASMPGMMDTVLNLGLNDVTAVALADKSRDRRFALDSYRRFITMYANVVLGIEHHHFEEILDDHKDRNGYTLDTDLSADDWDNIIDRYKERVEEESGKPFPQDPHAQLWGAIGAVFGSWMNQRAITYRRLHNIPESWGTAVNVQAMVFGNMGETSATGVAFTRNPSTGEKKLYGEFLINAQGEDVVAGIRTPQEITEQARKEAGSQNAVHGIGDAGRLRRAHAHPRRAGAALSRHAGSRIHRRAGQAVDAADAKRQAHGACGAAHRGRARQREIDHQGRSGGAHRSVGARSAAAPDHRSQRRAQGAGHRASGIARRRLRRDRVLLGRCRDAEEPGPQSDPGARRDLAGRHSRHACRRRHSDHARRHDVPCRGGRPRHGQALRLRRRRVARRLSRPEHDGRRRDAQERRYPHHRRLDRSGAGRPRADAGAGAGRRIRHPDEMGRRGAQAESARQCRHAGRRPRRDQIRRRGYRLVPHRAHVLRRGPHPRRARDDFGRG